MFITILPSTLLRVPLLIIHRLFCVSNAYKDTNGTSLQWDYAHTFAAHRARAEL